MNETINRLNQIPALRQQLEQQAQQQEAAARQARADMLALKVEQSELTALVNDAKIVKAVETSAAAAVKAQQAAEAAQAEAMKLVEELGKVKADFEAQLAKLKEHTAALETKPETPPA